MYSCMRFSTRWSCTQPRCICGRWFLWQCVCACLCVATRICCLRSCRSASSSKVANKAWWTWWSETRCVRRFDSRHNRRGTHTLTFIALATARISAICEKYEQHKGRLRVAPFLFNCLPADAHLYPQICISTIMCHLQTWYYRYPVSTSTWCFSTPSWRMETARTKWAPSRVSSDANRAHHVIATVIRPLTSTFYNLRSQYTNAMPA